MNPSTPDPLDEMLRQVRRDVPLPVRFQSDVWQRIADRETASPWTPLRAWFEQCAAALIRPRYVAATLAVAVLLGAGVAQLSTPRPDAATMQARYVASIDPYAARAQ